MEWGTLVTLTLQFVDTPDSMCISVERYITAFSLDNAGIDAARAH